MDDGRESRSGGAKKAAGGVERERKSGPARSQFGDERTRSGLGPRIDPTVLPTTATGTDSAEIEGVPAGVDSSATPHDTEGPRHSKAYLDVDVEKPLDETVSQVETIPRSPTLDSLLMVSAELGSVAELALPEGRGSVQFERSTVRRLDSVVDDDTDLWSFVGAASGDSVDDEHVVAGRYRIADDLGAGGMARIYKVRHLHLGKEFALKIIHPEISVEARLRRAFYREAQVASQLDHPNIVHVTDFGVDKRRGAYIVMEYLRGQTLRQRLRHEGRMRVQAALDVGLQVAEAVHYMHEQSIIHCDLKSDNVFLIRASGEGRRRPTVKLIDFGLSRSEVLGAKLAQSEVGGTPEYMAPEQIRRHSPQPSIDVYALGILLYEMLTGTLPFTGSLEEVVRAQLNDPARPPSEVLEELGDEPLDERAEALIMKALSKDSEERQGSMGQVIFELRTIMDMLGVPHARRRAGVVRRPAGVETDGPRLAFQHCPCPLFRLDRDASIMAANGAFCDFVKEPLERLLGKPLSATRIAPLYPDLRTDLASCAAEEVQIQHVINFTSKREGRSAAALVWLVPEFDDQQVCISFTGIIVPCHTITEPQPQP